jgi:hypothetical protein
MRRRRLADSSTREKEDRLFERHDKDEIDRATYQRQLRPPVAVSGPNRRGLPEQC